jgi:hypothetical protein
MVTVETSTTAPVDVSDQPLKLYPYQVGAVGRVELEPVRVEVVVELIQFWELKVTVFAIGDHWAKRIMLDVKA